MKELKCEKGTKKVYFPTSPTSLAPLSREDGERRELEKQLEKYKTEEFEGSFFLFLFSSFFFFVLIAPLVLQNRNKDISITSIVTTKRKILLKQ